MKLENYLKEHKINQTHFGRFIGVSRFHVNKLVREKRTPSFKLAKKIQEMTNGAVSINDFPMEPTINKCD